MTDPHSKPLSIYVYLRLILCLWLLAFAVASGAMADDKPPAPDTFGMPTGLPSGDPVNDTLWFTYYPARNPTGERLPAVIYLHPLGEFRNAIMRNFAAYLAKRGINGVVVMLPYHMRRLPAHDYPLRHYITLDVDRAVQAFQQSVADVRVVTDWLERRPDVDPTRIGVIGVSLGAIIADLAMGQDDRLSAGVTILGGGNLPDLYRRSGLFRLVYPWSHRKITPEEMARVRLIDPLTYADRNRPRRVLMIEAARDMLIPPYDSTLLWKALGKPPIRWLDTNHYGPLFGADSIMRAADVYLHQTWGYPAYQGRPLPPIDAPTVKVGVISGLDSAAEPMLSWQAIALGRRADHMTLLHFDLGWSGRGFYAGLAATLNAYMDLGVGRRFNGRDYKPYLSFHIVF